MRDDFDPVVADRFSVLDEMPVPDTWTRVQSKVLTHMPLEFTEEEATMIDLETPGPVDEQRRGPKRFVIALLVAAAAVIAMAIVAVRRDDSESPADQPSPIATVAPTVPPRALFGTQSELFAPGTYFVDEVDGIAVPRIFITIGEGWRNDHDKWGVYNGVVGGFISFNMPDRVYTDACHSSVGYQAGPLTTLDGMVAALTDQRGWVNVTPPTDASVDGYAGKTFQRTAPADFSGCTGSTTAFRGWDCCGDSPDTAPEIYYQPNEVETIRVLDLNGTVIVVSARLKPHAQAPATLAAVLDSIRIAQG